MSEQQSGQISVLAGKLFERLSTTIAIPTVASFTASEHFIVDTSKKAGVKISYLSENFKKYFLPKVEKNEVAAEELAVSNLLKYAYDSAIITALGGEAKVEITLGQFLAAFAKQPDGEAGTLLTNEYDSVCYVGHIRDISGVLWAVFGYWYEDGWNFEAGSLDDPAWWIGDLLSLSR